MTKERIWLRIARIFFILLCLAGFGFCIYQFWLTFNRNTNRYKERTAIKLQSALPQKKIKEIGKEPVLICILNPEKEPKPSETSADGTEPEIKHLSIQSPYAETKQLLFEEEKASITFNWDCDENKKINLSIYDSPDMKKPVASYTYNKLFSAEIELQPGIYWWKIICGNEYGAGKIDITKSEKPQPLSPSENYTGSYLNRIPEERFVWTESQGADSYLIRIANNEQLNNPVFEDKVDTNSVIVPDLGKGSWYWQVTPYYSLDNLGYTNPSDISSFVVLQNAELKKAELIFPKVEEIVSTKLTLRGRDILFKNIYFTWKYNPEAVEYELKLWSEKAQSEPYLTVTTKNNFYRLNPEETPVRNGQWFWQVISKDENGNTVNSEIHQFFTIETEADQTPVFPPAEYKLAEYKAYNFRFSWKKNFTADTTLQLASDPGFTDIIYTKTVSGNSATNPYLAAGTYYWRIISELDGDRLASDGAELTVVETLEAPVLGTPKDGSREVVKDNIPVKFTWKTVPGADYYRLRLYKKSNPDKVVYEKNYITSEDGENVSDLLIMDYMTETYYIWTVQAFVKETPLSSKNISYISSSSFKMRILKPVKLLLPLNGTSFDGIFAVTDPASFVWSSIDKPVSSKIVIYKDETKKDNNYSTINKPGYTQKMPKLYEGQYYWTIVARTADDLDISALEMRSFSVKTMPKLPKPEMFYPKSDLIINIDYIVENGLKVDFKWGKMEGIARYIFRIFKKEDPSPLFEVSLDPDTTEYTFDGEPFSNTLGKYNGGWGWSIEAQSDYEGELLQRGKTEIVLFNVDIPRNKPGDVAIQEEKKIRYGLDEDEELDPNIEKKLKNAKKPSEDKVHKTSKYSKKTKKSK